VLQTKENKAMILAAGLGTRLRPLTDDRPKALVEWRGKPLLDHVVGKLADHGFRQVIINVHHHAQMIMDHVARMKEYGISIVFSHEKEELLDTGGGIAAASWFFGDSPFLVHNVDVMSNIDLTGLFNAHLQSAAAATLAVKERATSRSLLMDRDGYLGGWRDNRSGEQILVKGHARDLVPIAFSAIQVMDPEVIRYFPREKKFPLMPFYLELAASRPVYLYRHDGDDWTDMGKLENHAKGEEPWN